MEDPPPHRKAGNKKVKACRNGANCGNPRCKFRHPPSVGLRVPGKENFRDEPAVETATLAPPPPVGQQQQQQQQQQPTTATTKVAGTGVTATNKKGKVCRYGADCYHPNCKFVHPTPPPYDMVDDNVAEEPSSEQQQHSQEKTPAPHPPKKEKPCRYGIHCHNKKCKFGHPPPPAAAAETAIPHDDVVVEQVDKHDNYDSGSQQQYQGEPPPPVAVAAAKNKKKESGKAKKKKAAATAMPAVQSDYAATYSEEEYFSAQESYGSAPNETDTTGTAAATAATSQQAPKVAVTATKKNETPLQHQHHANSKQQHKKKNKPCRYGLHCHNANCSFAHPEIPLAVDMLESSTSGTSKKIPQEEIPLAADVEKELLLRCQSSSLKEMQLAAQDIDALLKEQEQQRLKDAESLGRSGGQGVVVPAASQEQPKPAPPPPRGRVVAPTAQAARVTPSPPPTVNKKTGPYQKEMEEIRAMGFLQDKNNESAVRGALVRADGDVNQAVELLLAMSGSGGSTSSQEEKKEEPAMASLKQDDVDDEELSGDQKRLLQQMRDMGFNDRKAGMEALEKADGDLNRAVELLLNAPPPPPPPSSNNTPDQPAAPTLSPEEMAERERYRAERNKAKKERKRREKQAKEAAERGNGVVADDETKKAAVDETKVSANQQLLLKQMRDMGFHDETLATEALQKVDGDVNRAVELLLQTKATSPPPMQSGVATTNAATATAVAVENVETKPPQDDEERERYKAARKAAKKERLRLEREAKAKNQGAGEKEGSGEAAAATSAATPSVASSRGSFENDDPNDDDENSEEEAEKKRRWQEELRLQKERAAEKREEKKNKRREEMAKELKRQTKERAAFWQDLIADESKTVDLIVKLCVSEFCRKHKIFDQLSVCKNRTAHMLLVEAAREAYRDLYKDSLPGRVVVKGMKQQDLNDRAGTIECWDESKSKFSVQLDTKKGKSEQMFFLPENLEASSAGASKKAKKKSVEPFYTIHTPWLIDQKNLITDIFKSEIEALKHQTSDFAVDHYLVRLMQEREEEERLAKELEKEEQRREEEARQRRAAQRKREEEEWQERQRTYQERKEEYQRWKREEKQRGGYGGQYGSFGGGGGFGHRGGGPCNCRECKMERMFADLFGGRSRGGPFGGGGRGGGVRFGVGPTPGGGFGFFFHTPDGNFYMGDDSDDEDEWDRQWEGMHEEEELEKDQDAADLLGVALDADQDQIKRVFRKKALKFHPDKYHPDNHEDGMTKDEAENHFKDLSNAYDHMMGKFD